MRQIKLIIAALLLTPFAAHALVIDFEEGPFSSKPLPYGEDGFTFVETDGPASLIAFLATNNTALRLAAFADDNGTIDVQMSQDGGGAFSLFSFDVLSAIIDGTVNVVSSKGGVININSGDADSTVASLGADWQGITSVNFQWTFSTVEAVGVDFDNFVIGVPEPGTLALLGLGLLGTGLARRRRKV